MDNTLLTKERILKEAEVLFAEKGFHGTSIRDIADRAQVNIAAINYHFRNKQTLFYKVLESGLEFFNEKILETISGKDLTFEELSEELFHLFLKHDRIVLNCFKLFVSQHNVTSENESDFELLEDMFDKNTPSDKAIVGVLEKEIKRKLSDDESENVLDMIYVQLFHMSVFYSSNMSKIKCHKKKITKKHGVEKIRFLARTLVSYLRKGK